MGACYVVCMLTYQNRTATRAYRAGCARARVSNLGVSQMVTFYTYAQALRMYRAHKVRVPVLLSAQAVRIAKRARSTLSTAGLVELAVVAQPYLQRGMYQSNASFDAELLQMRCSAHYAQVAREMHA